MQLKPITAIAVLLIVVASLSLAGCTSTIPSGSSTGSVSTDYPTSGRSKLVEASVEYLRSVTYSNTKRQSLDVNWISNTKARTHEESVFTDTYDKEKKDTTVTHFPSTAEATTYIKNSGLTYPASSSDEHIIDYYKITGKIPTTYKMYKSGPLGNSTISQFDSLIIEQTWAIQKPD